MHKLVKRLVRKNRKVHEGLCSNMTENLSGNKKLLLSLVRKKRVEEMAGTGRKDEGNEVIKDVSKVSMEKALCLIYE